nr:hypothetical protein CcurKRNrm3_p048 [Cryptomonas curvata]
MIWKISDINLNIKYLKKTLYNKKKKELLTIYSDGTFYLWKVSLELVRKKNFIFFFNKKQRIIFVIKFGIGKIGCLDLYGNIIVIDIFSMKKLLIIKTKKAIWTICYLPDCFIGLTTKGDLCIFSGKKFQNFILFSIKKNQINYISNKNTNLIICAHKTEYLTEFNVLKSKFEKKIILNKFFKSKITILKHYQGITVIVSTSQEVFIFDNFYLLIKKVKNNTFKFGKIIFVLNFYKNFLYYSTQNGFLCIFNFKKITKTELIAKKISNNIIIGLHLLKKKKFLEIDIGNNYSFFINKNFFLSTKISKNKIRWVTEKNFSFNKKYMALFIENFLLIWSSYYSFYRKYPSLIVKLNNTINNNNFCCLAYKKNIIVTTLYSCKKIKFFKIRKFKNLYLCIELIVNIREKINSFYFSNKIIFSSDGKKLCGILTNKKKFFILGFKHNIIVLFFIKLSSKKLILKNEKFSNLVFINNQIILLTKLNSILIFDCKEGSLCFKRNFSDAPKIKSISTGFIKSRILILSYTSGKIQTYKVTKKKIFKLKQLFFSYLKIKEINLFGYNNQNALLLTKKGFLIIPFFFNIKKKNYRLFPMYFFKTPNTIFPIIFRIKKSFNKLVLLKCQ